MNLLSEVSQVDICDHSGAVLSCEDEGSATSFVRVCSRNSRGSARLSPNDMSSKASSDLIESRRGDGELADELLDEEGGPDEAIVVVRRKDVSTPPRRELGRFLQSPGI